MEKSLDWFKRKKVTSSFAVISLIAGFLFLKHEITGNVILNGKYSFNLTALIGLSLILCSVILAAYTLKKK